MGYIVKYSLLSFPLASVGLGIWQLKRLEWKKGLIRDLENQLQQEPMDLQGIGDIEEIKNREYRRIRVRGQYDTEPTNQILLKPRQLVINKEAISRGRTNLQSNVGACVVTPFTVDKSDLRILVNRGWLASKGPDNIRDSAHIGLDSGGKPIEVIGVIRKSDKRSTYGMNNNVTINEWHIRDIEAMANKLKTVPLFIDAEQDPKRTQGPIGGQTQLQIRNEHLNYAITWFSLAFFTLVMWYSRYGNPFRRRFRK